VGVFVFWVHSFLTFALLGP